MSTIAPAYDVQPWEISPEEDPALSSTDATFQWLCALSGDDVRPYLGQWIAARDCQVIASACSLDALLPQLVDVDLRTVIVHRFEKPGRVIYR